ncbi:DUF1045 domain-containing protein [Ramlibacter sp. H39-3-26]|uniref:DUF1045 domain-containing protein n=1 Tax=Curvibacter soli TaxID=3031331 RepID=UPI0023DBD164|nr:DUF1045 domain-containing protein [Ramlibacter sp. H39-3-26]MDF1484635.1 DUF1045 domain-containing protein [Ramlibacter sp. H39-3-26]
MTTPETTPGAYPEAYRYAVYFTHAPHSPWWQAGSAWLGRSALPGAAAPAPPQTPMEAGPWERLVADPRRYGWHATLRAPLRLAPGQSAGTLRQAVATLCRTLRAFDMPPLAVRDLGGFLALAPQVPSAGIQAVARACVETLHGLAAPLTPQELARRRQARLTPAQDALLLRWGYPFVMEEFRFHFSLTGPLAGVDAAAVDAVRRCAHQCFGALPATRFDALAIFAEPVKGGDFVLLERVPFGG